MIGLERWESSIMKPVQNFKIQIGVPWSGLEHHRNNLSLSLSFSLYSALNLQKTNDMRSMNLILPHENVCWFHEMET